MSALVTFKDIQKTYDGKDLVVKSLNLSVDEGEFVTLLGPSGSGKTTSLMMLAGFESPTSGEIWLNNQPIQNVAAYKRDIGVVFQNYALFPHMTVGENVAFPLSVRGVSKSEQHKKVSRALQMVKLDNMHKRYPAQLSGGQKQRVALARALVFEPKLVLMDEPLGALDKQLREHMQMEIRHLHEELGLTIIYVTHDQSEALTMSDRVAIFNDGAIQQVSDPKTIYEQPETKFVAGFIGENNTVNSTFVSKQDGIGKFKLRSGETVLASCKHDFTQDQEVEVFVRPERVNICASNEFSIAVSVLENIYLGDRIRLIAETKAGDTIVINQTAPQAEQPLAVGTEINISWDTRFAHALAV